jgi:hypothetical protein
LPAPPWATATSERFSPSFTLRCSSSTYSSMRLGFGYSDLCLWHIRVPYTPSAQNKFPFPFR